MIRYYTLSDEELKVIHQPPGVVSVKNFHQLMDRLEYIQKLALPLDNGREIHQNRLLQMAREGSRYSAQHLSRFHTLKRHATLMAFLIHIYAFLTDQGIHMSEKLIGRIFNRGEKVHKENFQKDGKAINEKVRLYAKVGKALIEAKEANLDPFESLQSIIPWEQFIQTVEQAEELSRPVEFDYLDLLDNHYGQLRKFAPRLLRTYTFKSSHASRSLFQAIELLREANRSKKRKIPETAPTSFIKQKWNKHVFKEDGIDRHYYEFSVLSELSPINMILFMSKLSAPLKKHHIIIDGLLYHETDLQIEEHYTDAAGFVDHVFAMCHMLGFRFSPRIKTVKNNNLYTFNRSLQTPLDFIIGGTIQVKMDYRWLYVKWDASNGAYTH